MGFIPTRDDGRCGAAHDDKPYFMGTCRAVHRAWRELSAKAKELEQVVTFLAVILLSSCLA